MYHKLIYKYLLSLSYLTHSHNIFYNYYQHPMFGTLHKCLEPEDNLLKLRKTVSYNESTPSSLMISQISTMQSSDKSSTSKELLFTPKKNKNSETKSISREGTSDSVNLTPLSNTTPNQDSRTYAYERLYHLHALNRAEAGKCK